MVPRSSFPAQWWLLSEAKNPGRMATVARFFAALGTAFQSAAMEEPGKLMPCTGTLRICGDGSARAVTGLPVLRGETRAHLDHQSPRRGGGPRHVRPRPRRQAQRQRTGPLPRLEAALPQLDPDKTGTVTAKMITAIEARRAESVGRGRVRCVVFNGRAAGRRR